MKNTVTTLLQKKAEGTPITQLTCYDYTTARLFDAAGIDTILVGDSLGNTMLGYENTLPVTVDEMITYGKSVVRGCDNAFVIVDMPFMSYQVSPAQALENAGRIIKETGANAVKLEGGERVAPQIRAIVEAGIPVCAHIGMTPQSVNAFGGFKVQGKGEAAATQLVKDALAVEAAGAFMVVLECVPPKLAKLVTETVNMITIGIGAGADCDGQVLVYQDAFGMSGGTPARFVKHFGEVGRAMTEAAIAYKNEVEAGTYPAPEHTYRKSDCSDEFLEELKNSLQNKEK